jgi:hypothetical protein
VAYSRTYGAEGGPVTARLITIGLAFVIRRVIDGAGLGISSFLDHAEHLPDAGGQASRAGQVWRRPIARLDRRGFDDEGLPVEGRET